MRSGNFSGSPLSSRPPRASCLRCSFSSPVLVGIKLVARHSAHSPNTKPFLYPRKDDSISCGVPTEERGGFVWFLVTRYPQQFARSPTSSIINTLRNPIAALSR